MKKSVIKLTSFAVVALMFSACGTSNKVSTTQSVTPNQTGAVQQVGKKMPAQTQTPSQGVPNQSTSKTLTPTKSADSVSRAKVENHVSTKVNIAPQYLSSKVRIVLPKKNSNFSLGGTLKMKSDERVQFSLVMPVFHNELMRFDVTPNDLLVIDRINKQYVRANKAEMAKYLPKGSNFSQLVKLLEDASKPGGKSELTGSEVGLQSMKDAKVELYDFSTDEIQLEPTVVSSRYKQVTVEEFIETLKELQ